MKKAKGYVLNTLKLLNINVLSAKQGVIKIDNPTIAIKHNCVELTESKNGVSHTCYIKPFNGYFLRWES